MTGRLGGIVAVAGALFLASAACNPAVGESGPATLRVGAAFGLTEFALGPTIGGSTAAALDLVYDPLDQHVEVVEQDGTEVVLRRLPSSPHGAATLAAALEFEGLVSARARGEEIVCQLASPGLVGSFVEAAGFDLGPLALEEQSPGRILLSAREPIGLDAIEILETDGGDEWRRLLGHELDVIPATSSLYRGQFDGMASVRLVDIPSSGASGLFFANSDPALADAAVRRAITRVIDPEAVARIACGDPGCAIRWWSPEAGPEPVALPAHLSLMTLDTSGEVRTARVVAHQLRAAGIDVEVESVSIEKMRQRAYSGDYQLGLMVLGFPLEDALGVFDRCAAVTGYRNPELDRALADRDRDRALRILGRDLPILPLFEIRGFAAVDRAFCGGQPETAHSWRWMAELHPCAEGER